MTEALPTADTVIHACVDDGRLHSCSPFCDCQPELVVATATDSNDLTGDEGEPYNQIIYRHRALDGELVSDFGDFE